MVRTLPELAAQEEAALLCRTPAVAEAQLLAKEGVVLPPAQEVRKAARSKSPPCTSFV